MQGKREEEEEGPWQGKGRGDVGHGGKGDVKGRRAVGELGRGEGLWGAGVWGLHGEESGCEGEKGHAGAREEPTWPIHRREERSVSPRQEGTGAHLPRRRARLCRQCQWFNDGALPCPAPAPWGWTPAESVPIIPDKTVNGSFSFGSHREEEEEMSQDV